MVITTQKKFYFKPGSWLRADASSCPSKKLNINVNNGIDGINKIRIVHMDRWSYTLESPWFFSIHEAPHKEGKEKVYDRLSKCQIHPNCERNQYALIINFKTFLNWPDGERHGSEEDYENLKKLLPGLGYNVTAHQDLTKKV